MKISIRDTYRQNGINFPVISIRNDNRLHFITSSSLKECHKIFTSENDGDGLGCGCKSDSSLQLKISKNKASLAVGILINPIAGLGTFLFGKDITIKEFGQVVPSWVSAAKRDHRPAASFRTIRGVLTKSKISGEDFPFRPWHHNYDWNYFVKTDKQFFYLNSPANHDYDKDNHSAIMECEWDSQFVPLWSRPMVGDRIQITGRWIFDCGHPEDGNYRSEIHPPKAVISFRDETDKFDGNIGLSRASQAVVFIGNKGGYFNQRINDQNYFFDIYLPPKPSSQSTPKFKIKKMVNTDIEPLIVPFPVDKPKLLRVVIPLKGKSIPSGNYGVIISGGWTDPEGLDAQDIKKVTVNVKSASLNRDNDEDIGSINKRDEWYLYVGINGRWKLFESMERGNVTLNHIVDLNLHKNQKIKISTSGYEADEVHGLLGDSIGLPRKVTSSSNLTSAVRKNAGKKIVNGFLKLGIDLLKGGGVENDKIGLIDDSLSATVQKGIRNPLVSVRKKDGKIIKDEYNIVVEIS